MIMFMSCIVYGLVTPQGLHMHTFREQVLPVQMADTSGFSAWTGRGFFYGVYAGLVFSLRYQWFGRRFGGVRVATGWGAGDR